MNKYLFPIILSLAACAHTNKKSIYTYNSESSEIAEPISEIFWDGSVLKNAKIEKCVRTLKPVNEGIEKIYGCSINISPENFKSILGEIETLKNLSFKCSITDRIKLPAKVPQMSSDFKAYQICTVSSEELFDFNDTIIYTNVNHTKILGYLRVLIVP